MTQEALAERSSLSVDTIRHLEHGRFSPSLETLRKLCAGFGLMFSTLFLSLEVGVSDPARELVDLFLSRTPGEQHMALRVLLALFGEFEQRTTKADDDLYVEAGFAPKKYDGRYRWPRASK